MYCIYPKRSFRTVTVDIYLFQANAHYITLNCFRTVTVDIYLEKVSTATDAQIGFRTVTVDIYPKLKSVYGGKFIEFSYSNC